MQFDDGIIVVGVAGGGVEDGIFGAEADIIDHAAEGEVAVVVDIIDQAHFDASRDMNGVLGFHFLAEDEAVVLVLVEHTTVASEEHLVEDAQQHRSRDVQEELTLIGSVVIAVSRADSYLVDLHLVQSCGLLDEFLALQGYILVDKIRKEQGRTRRALLDIGVVEGGRHREFLAIERQVGGEVEGVDADFTRLQFLLGIGKSGGIDIALGVGGLALLEFDTEAVLGNTDLEVVIALVQIPGVAETEVAEADLKTHLGHKVRVHVYVHLIVVGNTFAVNLGVDTAFVGDKRQFEAVLRQGEVGGIDILHKPAVGKVRDLGKEAFGLLTLGERNDGIGRSLVYRLSTIVYRLLRHQRQREAEQHCEGPASHPAVLIKET